MIPQPQLLRWKDWFSHYKFTIQHIKGKHNTITDMLSRTKPIHLLTHHKILPLFTMTLPIRLPITTLASFKKTFLLDFKHLTTLLRFESFPRKACFITSTFLLNKHLFLNKPLFFFCQHPLSHPTKNLSCYRRKSCGTFGASLSSI